VTDIDRAPDLTTALRIARRRHLLGDEATSPDGPAVRDAIGPLIDLIEALTSIGDRSAVTAIADLLVRVSGTDIEQTSDGEDGGLSDVAHALGRCGELDQAERFAATVSHPLDRDLVWIGLVIALTETGDLARAERTAEAIVEPDSRSSALIDLARLRARAGDSAGARRNALRARECITAIAETEGHTEQLNYLAQALLALDETEEARQVAGEAAAVAARVTDPHDPDWASVHAVHALALTGDFDRAEQLLAGITDEYARATALVKLVDGLGRAAEIDRALAAVATADADTRESALVRLVRNLIQAQDFVRAESIISFLPGPRSRADVLGELASALATAGDPGPARKLVEEAQRVAATIDDPITRSFVRHEFVNNVIGSGDLDLAEIVVLAEAESQDPVNELNRLARAMIDIGDRAGARRLIERTAQLAFESAAPQAGAWDLCLLAENLQAVGDTERALRALIEATRTGLWFRTLAAAAILDPDAVRAVAKDVLEDAVQTRA
jgi:tetratricopeptide (TPR) repeat protein